MQCTGVTSSLIKAHRVEPLSGNVQAFILKSGVVLDKFTYPGQPKFKSGTATIDKEKLYPQQPETQVNLLHCFFGCPTGQNKAVHPAVLYPTNLPFLIRVTQRSGMASRNAKP